MSAAATAWAWEKIKSGRVSGTAALVLLKLSDRADDDGKCWPSNQRTAVDCNIDERSARRATASLQKSGLLRKERRKREHGGDSSNHYFLPISETSGGEGKLPPPGGQPALPPEGKLPPPGGQPALHNHKDESHIPNLPQPQQPRARAAVEPVVVVSQEEQDQLVWPAGQAEDLLTGMRRILLGNEWPGPDNAQALLDELAGQLAVPGKVRNPTGLLKTLMEKQRKGEFTLEYGLEVQQVREARRKQQEREATALAGKGLEPASPGQQGSGTSEIAKRELELQLEKFPELAKRKAAKAAAHP